MRSRLLFSTVLTALCAVLGLGIPVGILGTKLVRKDVTERLEREADVVARAADRAQAGGKPLSADDIAQLLRPGHQATFRIGGRLFTVGKPIQGDTIRASSGPLPKTHVTVIASISESSQRVLFVWLVVGLLGLAVLAVAFAFGVVLSRRLTRPLEQLASAASRLGTGDFSARAGHHDLPEIDAVAGALDASAARIASLLAREREFSANVSHQLRTPLTALHLRLEEMQHAPDMASAQRIAVEALRQSERLEQTTRGLLALARDQTEQPGEFDVGVLIHEHAAGWRRIFARREMVLTLRAELGVRASGSAAAIGQALDVLLENALEHGADEASVTMRAEDGEVVIEVANGGAGVPPGLEEHVFERHISLHGSTGLGLAVARALIEREGGRLRLASARPAVFELYLHQPG
jgi:signal transduction histidine kinase